MPIGDVIDLHTFRPDEISELIPDYVDECVAEGLAVVRIIHGKGTGTLRRIVHAALDKHPAVIDYQLADDRSSWGATIVRLKIK